MSETAQPAQTGVDDVKVSVVPPEERDARIFEEASKVAREMWIKRATPASQVGSRTTGCFDAWLWPLLCILLVALFAIVLPIIYDNTELSTGPFVVILVLAILLTCAFFCCFQRGSPANNAVKALPVPGTSAISPTKEEPGHSRPYRSTRVMELINSMFPEVKTMADLWRNAVAKNGSRPAFLDRNVVAVHMKDEKRIVDGKEVKFQTKQLQMEDKHNVLTYSQADERVMNIANGLAQAMNLPSTLEAPPVPPDQEDSKENSAPEGSGSETSSSEEESKSEETPSPRLCIYAATQKDWMTTAQACFQFGIPVVTAYDTLGLDALAYALSLTKTTAVVADAELVSKLAKIITPQDIHDGKKTFKVTINTVKTVITIGDKYSETAANALKTRSEELGGPIQILTLDEVIANGKANPVSAEFRDARRPTPEHLAVVMFTSGSTGLPKGVMMSHRNLVAGATGIVTAIPAVSHEDVYLGYLPLAHVLEMLAEMAIISVGGSIGYGTPKTVTDNSPGIPRDAKGNPRCRGDAPLLRPTILAAVPAVMNKIRGTISSRVEKAGGLKKVLFNWGFNAKAKALKKGGSTPFWDRLLFDKIRTAALGGRTRLIVSGGGPLSGDVQRFMNVVFCCPVGQGYGLTETCAASSIVWADDRNVGRVGPPLLVNDIKLIDWPEGGYFSDKSGSGFPEGEVCIAGDNISLGYYAQPDLTREVYVTDKDGRRWFRTGDIGRIHPDGVLQIIDRKKDLVKLSGGEYVSFGKLESTFVEIPGLERCCIYADSLREYCVALVNILPAELPSDLRPSRPVEELAEDNAVKNYLLEKMAALGKERGFPRFEIPRRVYICAEDWSPDNGLLTTSIKVKRKQIYDRYKAELEQLYR